MYTKFKNESGFSLVEMLVSITLMLVVVGATLSLFSSSLKISNMTFEVTEAEQNQRTAQEYISKDLINAGAGLPKIDGLKMRALRSFVEKHLVRSTNQTGTYVYIGLLVADNDIPANTVVVDTNPTLYALEGTDRLTMLAPSVGSGDAHSSNSDVVDEGGAIIVGSTNGFKVGDICFISSGTRQALGTITAIGEDRLIFGNGDIYGMNKVGMGGPVCYVAYGENDPKSSSPVQVEVIPVRLIQYCLDENKLLRKRIFGSSSTGVDSSTVIAEHISDLDFGYDLLTYSSELGATGNIEYKETLSTTDDQNRVFQVVTAVAAESVHKVVEGTNSNKERVLSNIILPAMSKKTLVRNYIHNKVKDPTGINQ
jgi:prepilin-type N-terminal cleavage/methylation domain-containing protein